METKEILSEMKEIRDLKEIRPHDLERILDIYMKSEYYTAESYFYRGIEDDIYLPKISIRSEDQSLNECQRREYLRNVILERCLDLGWDFMSSYKQWLLSKLPHFKSYPASKTRVDVEDLLNGLKAVFNRMNQHFSSKGLPCVNFTCIDYDNRENALHFTIEAQSNFNLKYLNCHKITTLNGSYGLDEEIHTARIENDLEGWMDSVKSRCSESDFLHFVRIQTSKKPEFRIKDVF